MEETVTENSLMQAHESGAPVHTGSPSQELADNGTSLERERKPAPQTQRDEQPEDDGLGERNTLAGRASEIAEETRAQARNESEEHAALAELLGVAPDDLSVHKSLRGFSADVIAGYCEQFGLEADDLADSKIAKMLVQQMTADGETSEAEESDEETDEEKPTEEADKPKEETKAVVPVGKGLAELNPEERQAMQQHAAQIWERSQQVNQRAYTELFAATLADALGTPPEHRETLDKAVSVLQYGAQSLMESALPALVHNYLAQTFPAYVENFVPGLTDSFREATVANTWSETIAQDEFKDLGLPEFGTKEFYEAAEKVHKDNPWLNNFDPPGPDGKQLPVLQALKIKAAVTARLLSGARMSPKHIAEQVRAAVETGRKSAEKNTRRVSAGRALKGGRSTGGFGEERYTSLRDAFLERHGIGGID